MSMKLTFHYFHSFEEERRQPIHVVTDWYTVYITCIMKIIVISHNRQVKHIVLSIKSLDTCSPLSINFK